MYDAIQWAMEGYQKLRNAYVNDGEHRNEKIRYIEQKINKFIQLLLQSM